MITDLELIDSPSVGTAVVRCFRVRLGSEVVGIIGSEDNKILAVCAHRLSGQLSAWLSAIDTGEAFTQCAGLQCVLGVGYVYASYAGAEWITGLPRLMRELQKVVRPVLLGEPELLMVSSTNRSNGHGSFKDGGAA